MVPGGLRHAIDPRERRRRRRDHLAELPCCTGAFAATSHLIVSTTPSRYSATNALTTSGSKRSPASFSIAVRPASADHASLYGRFEVSASKTSATETMRAAREISSAFLPSG